MALELPIYAIAGQKPMYAFETEEGGMDHLIRNFTIRELAETVARVVGFEGRLEFDTSKPDGAPRKLLDVSRLRAHGWTASTGLEEGLRLAYDWYRANVTHGSPGKAV